MNARRVTSTILASLGALVGALLLSSTPTLAARGHVFSGAFASKGAGAGQLTEPAGVAVEEASGDVYVVDRGNDRVEYFTSSGAYIGEFNGSGANLAVEGKAAPSGRLSEPQGIAIDNDPGSPSYGDVYVADEGHEAIDKFSATGAYVGQLTETSGGSAFGEVIGIAVGPDGVLSVYQGSGAIDSFNNAVANEFVISHESQVGSEGFFGGNTFAVDSSGDFYIKSFFKGIVKLDGAGKIQVGEFDDLLEEQDAVEYPGAVAVDLSNDEVYIDDAEAENGVARFTSAGAFIEDFGSAQLTKGSGIAIDSGADEIYVADEATGKIDAYEPEAESRPTIASEGPSAVTGTSATLNAQLKPTGPDTSYYFQYGAASCSASPSSCSDVPAAPGVDIGGGFGLQSVDVHLQGLQPATAYRFRVVAVNELGTSYGVEQGFTTQTVGGEFALPDGRSWEMVTPPDKYGSDLIAVGNEQGAAIQAAADGSAITYGATTPFAVNPAGSRSPEVTQVLSARAAPGSWSSADITTPHTEGATELAVGHSAEYKLFSTDLSAGLIEPEGHTPLPPLPAGAEKTLYLRLVSGEYEALVTAANVPAGTKFGGNGQGAGALEFLAATPDLSHVVIGSSVGLTGAPGDEGGLYVWADGQLQQASVLPNGTPTQAALGEHGEMVRNTISNDGSRLVWRGGFFSSGSLYMRDLTSRETVQVDAAQGAPEPASPESHYKAANSEDSRIFFTSPERLTTNATPGGEGREDLYEFEVTSGSSEPLSGKLTDLSVDANAGEGADVRGVIGASEDGSDVYFVANGVLGDGAEHGAKPGDCERGHELFKETCTLYVEQYDAVAKTWSPAKSVATLSGADHFSWGARSNDLDQMAARVSPNGRYLAFMSEMSLTGYENRDANSGVRDEEVYLYDASAARLVCASCNPSGARPAGVLEGDAYEERIVDYTRGLWGNRWLAANIPGWTTKDLSSALYQSRYLSNSGRLFFNSSDALVPADVNGNEDVYEYEPIGVGGCQAPDYGQSAADVFDEGADGCVGLISAGTSSEESAFMDASETGGDVFFITESKLAPQDVDTSLDLYDAHECATASPCAPPTALAPPPCTTGDACKAAPTPQPAIFGAPSSETFSGAGNVVPSTAAPSVTQKSVSQTRKLAKALKACSKKPKRSRAACKRRARKRYGATKSRVGKSLSARTGR
jgi:DNA-binding beta-propeller fold protein YncE